MPGLTVVFDQKENALIASPAAAIRSWLRPQPGDGPMFGAAATFTRQATREKTDARTLWGQTPLSDREHSSGCGHWGLTPCAARWRWRCGFAVFATPAAAQNRSEDEYTRYELLAPETASFKIIYDVTAVSPARSTSSIRSARQRRDRRIGDRSDDRRAAQVPGGQRRRKRASRDSPNAEPRQAATSASSSRGRCRRRRGPHPHHQDLQGSQELLPRRQRDRVRSSARHQAQRRRAAARLRARVVQHSRRR